MVDELVLQKHEQFLRIYFIVIKPILHSAEVVSSLIKFVRGVACPDLKDEEVVVPPISSFAEVAMYRDRVLKKPYPKSDPKAFAREVRVQDVLKLRMKDMGYLIPEITIDASEHDTPFVEMKRVSGEVVTADLIAGLPLDQQNQLAKDIAQFMLGVRAALTADDIKVLGLEKYNDRITSEALAKSLDDPRVQNILGTQMLEKAKLIQSDYAIFLETPPEVVPVHGDLHSLNLLFDRKLGRLTGVVDFGFVCIKSVEQDFTNMAGMPRPFVEMLAMHYENGGGGKVSVDRVLTLHATTTLHNLRKLVADDRFEGRRQRVVAELPSLLEGAPRLTPERRIILPQPAPAVVNKEHG